MGRLELTLLGGFQARIGAGALTLPTRKAQALVAFLALTPGRSYPREKLAALLWGGTREPHARQGLRQARQSARSWELRAAVSLAGVLDDEGQREQAQGIVAGVYERFTEGFETADLRDARALMTA